ncbi:Uncharacterised protein [Streptococcus pneumoniae]|nr:Uncharacterised protein [Streptococcus pneumoniae]VTJ18907.1 Uncharacterised protein [Streptococcus pneumoniae]
MAKMDVQKIIAPMMKFVKIQDRLAYQNEIK